MVYESIDHGNDVTCHALPIVLFLAFRKKNVIVKNKSTTIFCGLHSSQNVQNFAVKTLACGLWIHLSFEHFMTSFLWSIRAETTKNCGRFVNYPSEADG